MDPKNALRKLRLIKKVFDALPKKNINQSWKFKDALLPTVEKLLALSMVIGLALAPTPSRATGDIPDDMKPVAAATRIFALREHLHGDIGVFDADEGHISRGKVNNGEDYEVNHAPGQKCTFTMKRRDGPILFSINFNRLSSEYRTSRRDVYTLLNVAGLPGAVCDYQPKKCWNGLEMLLLDNGMEPHELELAVRALQYIFANVCKPTEMPF